MESSTFSIWEQESFLAPRDVIIIGGGLVGLWSAWFLKKSHPDLRVALLERGLLPSGASTRNAGFACFGSPGEILQDQLNMGKDEALQLVEMRFRGLEVLRQELSAEGIRFESCGGYECFTDGPSYESVLNGLDDLNLHLRDITGHFPVFSPADHSIKTLSLRGFDHLISNPLEGALHSGKLVQALTHMVQAAGVQIFTGTTVNSWEEAGHQVLVHTDRSFSLSCHKLLICTNGFAGELLPGADVSPARGQILVTAPIPGLRLKGTFHYDEGFYYFRHLGDRILLGGARNQAIEEEATADSAVSDRVQDALDRFLHKHLLPDPSIPVTHRWAGIMGMGNEKAPLIKRVREQVYCAVRMSGVGVAISPLVGKQVAKLMAAFLFLFLPFRMMAQSKDTHSFGVKIYGQGPPMMLIPGLKGDGDGTWNTTVDHFKDRYTCYVITLAGFAGQPPSGQTAGLLRGQRDELLSYIIKKRMVKPVLVGFSFGGVLALWMASSAPDLFGPVIDIDGVPYDSGLEDPNINQDSLLKSTEDLIAKVSAFTPARIARIDSIRHTIKDQMEAFHYLKRLISQPAHIPPVIRWDTASDIRSSLLMELEMRALNLEGAIASIKSAILVLGSWKGYDTFTTLEQAETAYRRQFMKAPRAIVHFSANGRHFLMWDDFAWMCSEMDNFLSASPKVI